VAKRETKRDFIFNVYKIVGGEWVEEFLPPVIGCFSFLRDCEEVVEVSFSHCTLDGSEASLSSHSNVIPSSRFQTRQMLHSLTFLLIKCGFWGSEKQ
jgi:hypothetical protein